MRRRFWSARGGELGVRLETRRVGRAAVLRRQLRLQADEGVDQRLLAQGCDTRFGGSTTAGRIPAEQDAARHEPVGRRREFEGRERGGVGEVDERRQREAEGGEGQAQHRHLAGRSSRRAREFSARVGRSEVLASVNPSVRPWWRSLPRTTASLATTHSRSTGNDAAQKEGRGGEEAAVLVPAQDRGLRARRGRVRQRGVGRHLGQAGGRRDAELPPDDRQAGEPEEFGRRRRQHAAHAPARAEPALQPALPLLEGPDLHVHRVHPDRRQPVQGAHVLRRPGDGVVPRQVDRRAAAAPLRDGRPRVPLDEGAAVAAGQFLGAILRSSHALLRTPRLRRSTAARSRS